MNNRMLYKTQQVQQYNSISYKCIIQNIIYSTEFTKVKYASYFHVTKDTP